MSWLSKWLGIDEINDILRTQSVLIDKIEMHIGLINTRDRQETKALDKLEHFEDNIQRISTMLLEFKGIISMQRAILADRPRATVPEKKPLKKGKDKNELAN